MTPNKQGHKYGNIPKKNSENEKTVPRILEFSFFYHFHFLAILNKVLIPSATPNIEKTERNHGSVPNLSSKYCPNNTPINTDAAIDTPICVKSAKARKTSLYFFGGLSLLCPSSKDNPSFSMN